VDIEIGAYVVEQFLRLAYERGFEVLAYCVMTDHFHVLVEGHQDDAALKRLMHRWKQATGYWWKQQGHKDSLWQEGYFDRILREKDVTQAVVHDIVANPLRAGLISDLRDYRLVGSGTYDLDTLMASGCDWEPPWHRRV